MAFARTAGRKGRPWRRLRAQILAASDQCWICGHRGSTEIDHVIARSQGGHPLDPANLRPAHGANGPPCPVCGRRCNQERGVGDRARPMRKVTVSNTSRQW